MKLIIQIPCFNEADTLEIALNDLPDAGFRKLAQLAGKNRLPRGNLRHALGMLRGQDAHAASQS